MENREDMHPQAERVETAETQEFVPESITGVQEKKRWGRKLLDGIKYAFDPSRWKKTACLLGAAAAVLAAVIMLIKWNSAGAVAVRYCRGYYDNPKSVMRLSAYDWEKYVTSSSKDEADFFEKISEESHEEITSWHDLYKAMRSELRNELEDDFGKYKIVLNVTKVRDISVKKLSYEQKDFISELEKTGCFDADEMKAGKEVTVKAKIVGEDETSRDTFQVYMVKMRGGWKALTYERNHDS